MRLLVVGDSQNSMSSATAGCPCFRARCTGSRPFPVTRVMLAPSSNKRFT